MTKLRFDKLQFMIVVGYLLSVGGILILPGIFSIIVSLIYILVVCMGGAVAKGSNGKASVTILLLPIVMSVLQNVYLAMATSKLDSIYLQVLLSLHFLLFTGVVVLNFQILFCKIRWAIICIIVLVGQSILLFIIYPTNITAVLSSMRNILSCILIYCFGFVMSKRAESKDYYKWVTRMCWFVVVFGVFEWLVGLGVWRGLGIKGLWELKGLPLKPWGIPSNWYSSERIGGNIVRRMVASFADPVNLGTFLFAAFMIAWYKKKRMLMYIIAICAILTVSKGALLGFLIFIVIFIWQKRNLKLLLPVTVGIALTIGFWFINYSLTSSSGSMVAHFWGFVNSFSALGAHPLGVGLGNVGVLSNLFNKSLLNSSVSETGIGMLAAQLGVVGLAVYVFFFVKVGLVPGCWPVNQRRERVLYYTLLFSFIANAMFNEVALSPNSCGLYFIEMAFLSCEINKSNSPAIPD